MSIKFFYLFLSLFCFNSFSYKYDHLPISKELIHTFPALNATCFIILNEKSRTILHERNSNYKIRFDDRIKKESLLYIVQSYYDGFNSHSQISGNTFVFSYVNNMGCSFKIALSGLNSSEEFEKDKEKIVNWLGQFFLFKVCYKNEFFAKIPVVYGDKTKTIDMLANYDVFILISNKQSKYIKKVITYKSAITAPCKKNTNLGYVSFFTQTFSKPQTISVRANSFIPRESRWKIMLDSVKLLIFGVTNS